MPKLTDHRTTIALDLPGFGRSSKPTDVRYGFSFFNRVLDGALDQLGLDSVGLVVHDLGGPIGIHWAVENPQRVRELVVLNTLVFAEFHWMVKAFIASASLPGVSHALTSTYGIRASMRFGMNTKPRPEILDLYTSVFETPQDRRALATAGRQLSPAKFARTADRLDRLEVPTLLMYGTGDRILPDVAKTMSRLQSVWPHAEKVVLTGLGHFLQEDDPDGIAEHMDRFITRSA